jgi:AcrR family transcriptional regulator
LSATRARYGSSGAYPALPPGRNLLSRDYVDEYQQRRLVVAVAEIAHEAGLAGVTVTALTDRVRMSRKTFYEHFRNRDECIDCACGRAEKYLFGEPDGADSEKSANKRVAAAIADLLGAVAAEPTLSELALVHAPALGGERGRRFQQSAIEGIGTLLGLDQGERRGQQMIASAVMGLIAFQIRVGEAKRAGELADEVVRLAGLGEPEPAGPQNED